MEPKFWAKEQCSPLFRYAMDSDDVQLVEGHRLATQGLPYLPLDGSRPRLWAAPPRRRPAAASAAPVDVIVPLLPLACCSPPSHTSTV